MHSKLDNISDWKARSQQAHFRVALLARSCGVTERQLRRYFRKMFGVAPHAWISAKRLEGVRPLLATNYLIKEVAAQAGFSQPGNFSRKFKQHYKISPSRCGVPNDEHVRF
jgi:AraC family transcriptional regulator